MGEKREKKKTVGRDGQVDRQTAQRSRLTSLLPVPTTHPRPRLVAPGLICRDGQREPSCLRAGAAGWYLTTASGRGSLFLDPLLLQDCSLLMGKSQRRKHGVSEGDSGMCEAR